MIRWRVDFDTRGTDFSVDILFDHVGTGKIFAGMPFDILRRPSTNPDLLPRQLDSTLSGVLMGQRELGSINTFPFQEFVSLSDGTTSTTIMAKGLHSYQVTDSGKCAITLRRAIEWLTRPDLENRIGDAGPFFYVPDARCERTVSHLLSTMITHFDVNDPQFLNLSAEFQNPPLLVENYAGGVRSQWQLLQEDLPLSSLQIDNERLHARFYNPTTNSIPLSEAYLERDLMGNLQKAINVVPPKKIINVTIGEYLPPIQPKPNGKYLLIKAPFWRVGPNQGLPDRQIIQQLKNKIHELARQIEEASEKLDKATGKERYILEHRIYVLERERVEYLLSVRLNEAKLEMQGQLSYDYLYGFNDEIADIGLQLNRLRIKRRIYDYVVQTVL